MQKYLTQNIQEIQKTMKRPNLIFNNNINNRKPTFTWKMNNTLLNDSLVKDEIKKETKDFLEFNKNEATTYPN